MSIHFYRTFARPEFFCASPRGARKASTSQKYETQNQERSKQNTNGHSVIYCQFRLCILSAMADLAFPSLQQNVKEMDRRKPFIELYSLGPAVILPGKVEFISDSCEFSSSVLQVTRLESFSTLWLALFLSIIGLTPIKRKHANTIQYMCVKMIPEHMR